MTWFISKHVSAVKSDTPHWSRSLRDPYPTPEPCPRMSRSVWDFGDGPTVQAAM